LSAIGTGIAASVAQVGLQSQQVARQRDKRENNRTNQAMRDTEVFETRLIGLEEHDADEQATRLHVDNQQSGREHPDLQQEDQPDVEPDLEDPAAVSVKKLPDADTLLRQLAATADPAVQRKATQAPADPDALYAHIDVKA
jgi:hypothetical protein